MGEKLVIGPINRGLRNDRTAFVIDNDSFPTLINAYQWRGRVKRKRGTQEFGQLERYFNSTIPSYSSTSTIPLSGGSVNLFTGFSLQSNASLVPSSLTITNTGTGEIFTDNGLGGLNGNMAGTGSVNYASGVITITGGGGASISAVFNYYPSLPVMGIEDWTTTLSAFPGTISFDTKYSYNVDTAFPYPITDVSFYKNPPTGAYPGYIQKQDAYPVGNVINTPTTWNGLDYQQFYTTNYQGALWATNGIKVPFDPSNIGMQFSPPADITFSSNTATTITLVILNCPLVIGDFVFFNEWSAPTPADSQTLNFQTGYVTACSPNTPGLATKTVTITLPNATLTSVTFVPGIIQYLTTRRDITKDTIRWYDGSPTNGLNPPSFVTGKGWVNFMPPLSQLNYIIDQSPLQQFYLVGARLIVPFKDRLLFFGPVIQASTGDPIYLQDVVIFSQEGTAYYTCSFTGNPILATTVFIPILVPFNQTATAPAYFEDQIGFGGVLIEGTDQPINTVAFNDDALIVGFSAHQTRLVSTGNKTLPFSFFSINTEYGSSSTFSTITLDRGILTFGEKGFVITSQEQCERFDLVIPDQVFQISALNNGIQRFCAQRDFINEWVYFTYSAENSPKNYYFPNQTLQYNYRDNSWAILDESYTAYGTFRKQSGLTWSTVGAVYKSWSVWNDPWDSGVSTLLKPLVLAGTTQGFLVIKGVGTGETPSMAIQSFSGNTVTSINHMLNEGDFVIITNSLGTIASAVNGKTFKVSNVTPNTFRLSDSTISGTYLGLGLVTRAYVPTIQTKQFPIAWELARKTRLGPQQYLLTKTNNSQITLLIFLSQNASNAYNTGPIVPDLNVINNSLIYSTILYTCPESTNLGLTPANINLQTPTASNQQQIWHRINTSLIGDTIQIGFTLSDDQMLIPNGVASTFPITGATQTNPCILTCTGNFESGEVIFITGVNGMTQLNGNYYTVISSTLTTVTIQVDATGFDTYQSGGTASPSESNIFSEIELHSFILDVSPSQLLC